MEASGIVGYMASPDQFDVDSAEVVRRKIHLLTPDVRRGRQEVERLLHPQFFEFGASGTTWEREAIAAALLQTTPGDAVEAHNLRPLGLSPDVILLTYRTEHDGSSALRSSVWVRDDGEWRLRFHQGTAGR